MTRLLAFLALTLGLPLIAQTAEYEASLVIETGRLVESDLVVRNITDLNSRKTCMAFYVRTAGTSPVMHCYDVVGSFGTTLSQVAHIKEKDLVVRKVTDLKNGVACIVTYVSTPGTSPSISCYPSKAILKESIVQDAHLHEGDLDVRRISDRDSAKACLVTYVSTRGTSPSVTCYESKPEAKSTGGLHQVSHMREGDLIVRKVVDPANGKACLASYVSTAGTSSRLYCFDE
jgi:hypothetical protein